MWGPVKLSEVTFRAPLIVREFGFRCWWRLFWGSLRGRQVTLLCEVFRNIK